MVYLLKIYLRIYVLFVLTNCLSVSCKNELNLMLNCLKLKIAFNSTGATEEGILESSKFCYDSLFLTRLQLFFFSSSSL